jgi:hypothetical protein
VLQTIFYARLRPVLGAGFFPALFLALFLALFPAAPARATTPFSYEWKSPRVTVTWREGNQTPDLPALRRQVAHWKRLAQTLWSEKPAAPPLEMTVSLYGDALGGTEPPRVHLKSGGRALTVDEPITEEAVGRALLQLRDGAAPAGDLDLPPDDSAPRISPDGKWLATISWRGNGPEVWATRRHAGSSIVRVRFDGAAALRDRLIQNEPQWSADGRLLAWIQGGRVLLLDVATGDARLASAAGKRAVECSWALTAYTPLAVRYDDDTFELFDILRGVSVPVSDLLRDAAPASALFWSPTGRKLLFKTQSRIVTADLSGPLGVLARGERLIGRLAGPPEPPKDRSGSVEERIAVLDLAARRLDAYPAAIPPGLEIGSAAWSRGEDLVMLAAGVPEGPSALVRFPLRHDAAPETVLESAEPLAVLGPRGEDGWALLQGERLLLLTGGAPEPYSAEDGQVLALPPGPFGGYLGVEDELLTEDEPGLRVALESLGRAGGEPLKRRFPGGLLAALPLEGEFAAVLLAQLRRPEVVDADIHPEVKLSWLAVVESGVESGNGGVGRVVAFDADAKKPLEVERIPFSERLSQKSPIAVSPKEVPFALTDARSGIGTLAVQYRRFDVLRLLLIAVALLAAGGVIFLVRSRTRPG